MYCFLLPPHFLKFLFKSGTEKKIRSANSGNATDLLKKSAKKSENNFKNTSNWKHCLCMNMVHLPSPMSTGCRDDLGANNHEQSKELKQTQKWRLGAMAGLIATVSGQEPHCALQQQWRLQRGAGNWWGTSGRDGRHNRTIGRNDGGGQSTALSLVAEAGSHARLNCSSSESGVDWEPYQTCWWRPGPIMVVVMVRDLVAIIDPAAGDNDGGGYEMQKLPNGVAVVGEAKREKRSLHKCHHSILCLSI